MFSDPKKILKAFGVYGAITVVDLGAGSGFYTLQAARAVTPDGGKVYSIDINKGLVERIASEARTAHLSNVEIIWGDIEKKGGTKLRDAFADRVIIANTLFALSDKDTCIEEAKRILKSDGRLLAVDWSDSFKHMGPHPDHVITKEVARKLFEAHGFVFDREIEAGSHHWGIVFRKT